MSFTNRSQSDCVSYESYLVRLDDEATQVFVWRRIGRNKIKSFV